MQATSAGLPFGHFSYSWLIAEISSIFMIWVIWLFIYNDGLSVFVGFHSLLMPLQDIGSRLDIHISSSINRTVLRGNNIDVAVIDLAYPGEVPGLSHDQIPAIDQGVQDASLESIVVCRLGDHEWVLGVGQFYCLVGC